MHFIPASYCCRLIALRARNLSRVSFCLCCKRICFSSSVRGAGCLDIFTSFSISVPPKRNFRNCITSSEMLQYGELPIHKIARSPAYTSKQPGNLIYRFNLLFYFLTVVFTTLLAAEFLPYALTATTLTYIFLPPVSFVRVYVSLVVVVTLVHFFPSVDL